MAAAVGSAPAAPGDGIPVGGNVVARPFLDVSISYDSNPILLPGGEEAAAWFWDANPGVRVTRAGDVLRLDGVFWSRLRRSSDPAGEESDDWSEELRIDVGRRENRRLRFHERYGRVSDYTPSVRAMDPAAEDAGDREPERPEAVPLNVMARSGRVERSLFDGGVGWDGALTDKTSLDILCDYGTIDYRATNLLDSVEQKVSVKVGYKITDKSKAILAFDYTRMKNDSLADPAASYAGRVGWGWQGTSKSRFEGTAGWSVFTGDEADSGGDTLDRGALSYDLAWNWRAMEKLSVSLIGRSEMQLAPDAAGNAKLVDMMAGSAQYSATERLALTLRLSYRREDFTLAEAVAGGAPVDRAVEQLQGGLSCGYRLSKWLTATAEVWQENTRNDVLGDYNETRGTLSMKSAY